MKRQKDGDRIVFQSLAMVMQFGLNMLVPICVMSALGIWLDGKLGTSCFTILLFAVGAVAGGQNIYHMAKGICDSTDEVHAARGRNPASGESDKRKSVQNGDAYEINRKAEKDE